MKKNPSSPLVLMLVVMILTACSGSEEIAPPTGSADTVITTEERMEVFEACRKKSAELNNLEDLEDRVNFITWLGTQPAFESFGFVGEDLYAVFVDGRIVLFVNTPVDKNTGRKITGRRPFIKPKLYQ